MYKYGDELKKILKSKENEIIEMLEEDNYSLLYEVVNVIEQNIEIVCDECKIYPMYKIDEVLECKGYSTSFMDNISTYNISFRRWNFNEHQGFFGFKEDGYMFSTDTPGKEYKYLIRSEMDKKTFIQYMLDYYYLFRFFHNDLYKIYEKLCFIQDFKCHIEAIETTEEEQNV